MFWWTRLKTRIASLLRNSTTILQHPYLPLRLAHFIILNLSFPRIARARRALFTRATASSCRKAGQGLAFAPPPKVPRGPEASNRVCHRSPTVPKSTLTSSINQPRLAYRLSSSRTFTEPPFKFSLHSPTKLYTACSGLHGRT